MSQLTGSAALSQQTTTPPEPAGQPHYSQAAFSQAR
jgi:hypothetical protein